MSTLRHAEPLNFSLSFTHTPKANAKAGVRLLSAGDYRAVELRQYNDHQRCHGCDTAEKAMNLVVVEDRLTRDRYEIGLVCMRDLYGVNIERLKDHAKDVARARREIQQKLGLTGDLSNEQAIRIVREALVMHVPDAERYTADLDAMDVYTPTSAETGLLRDLHQLACYHREWREDPEWARRRWTALRGHPAFQYAPGPQRQSVRDRCERALTQKGQLGALAVRELHVDLRRAAAHHDTRPRWTRPEDHPDAEAYRQHLKARVEREAQSGHADANFTGSREAFTRSPLDFLSVDGAFLYASVAVWEDHAEAFAQRVKDTDRYYQKVQGPVVAIGPVETYDFPEVRGQFRNRDNELEEYVREEAFTFRYRRVVWALVEPYGETHRLWRAYGRDRLERYA